MHTQYLPAITLETGAKPTHSIIWLHGLGADGHDFEPIVPQLNIPSDISLRFIFPHAPSMPVSINGGYIMPAWYDIVANDIGIQQDEVGIRQSEVQVQHLIDREIMRGIKPEHITLAGFSQGGAMALHCGLRQSQALGGIIALSCYILLHEKTLSERHPQSINTPVFVGHGIEDSVVPFALGDNIQRQLKAWGHQVTWHSYPMQHHVSPAEIAHIGQWLKQLLTRS